MAFRIPEYAPKGSHRYYLELLIDKGQEIAKTLGIDFDSDEWTYTRDRGARHRKGKLSFTRFADERGAQGPETFPEPFSSLAKSILLQFKVERSCSFAYLGQFLVAFRLLHSVAPGRHPTLLTSIQWDAAMASAVRRYNPSTHASHGYILQLIADYLDEYQITAIPLYWKTQLTSPAAYWSAPLDPGEGDAGASKFPDPAIFEALPDIYRQITSDQDRLLASMVLLLMCGGFRSMELLTLPADCWHEELQTKEGGKQILLDAEGNPVMRFGIRYVPAKGGQTASQIKFLPTVMAPLAKKAVDDIRRITTPYRANAKFMHDHIGHAPVAADPGTLNFTSAEAVQALGIQPESARLFFKSRNLPYYANARCQLIRREQLEGIIRSSSILVPVMIKPWTQELHESLFVVEKGFFSTRGNSIRGSAVPVSYTNLREWLCGHKDPRPGRNPTLSIFERFQKLDSQGHPLKVNSHQFRHWINTLMHRGGLSDIEIARWSGRKSISQNPVYNHMSPLERAQLVRKLSAEGKVHGPVQAIQRTMNPVRREEFREAIFQNIHTTDLGYCIHDYASVPREAPPECATCSGLLIPKGNPKAKSRAEHLLAEEEWLVNRAQEELQEGTYGASPWLDHHLHKLDQLRRIVALHEDPQVANGDLFQITPARGSKC